MNIATNKKASFDYFLEDRHEAGIVLKGTEVKSIKAGKVSIKESYVKLVRGEIFIINMFVNSYEFGNIHNEDERRTRKLLLHKKEIKKLIGKIKEKGFTMVATRVYLKRGRVKVEIALGKGKKNYDKREILAKKDASREIQRSIKDKRYN